MNIVNWSFITSHIWDEDHQEIVKNLIDNSYYPYKSLAKEVVSARKGATFLKCPSHTDFLKNTFIFCAPFDLTIDIDIKDGNAKVFCENINQDVFDLLVDIRFLSDYNKDSNPYPLIGIDWLNIFTCKESILMQVLPAFMHYNDFNNKCTIIPGEFDISKWTRPVELVFEVKSNKENIFIKKDDALFYIKFNTDDIVKLENQQTPWNEIKLCNDIRQENTFRPLKERYASLENKRIKRCPYE